MGMCEGRVCIVTGAGRGIGREHALDARGRGRRGRRRERPRRRGGRERRQWRAGGRGRRGDPGLRGRGGRQRRGRVVVGGRASGSSTRRSAPSVAWTCSSTTPGSCRDRMLTNMTEDEWDAVMRVHLKGTFAPSRWAASYWREQVKAGETVDGRIINTTSASGLVREPRADELRGGEGGHRAVHDHRCPRAATSRRHGRTRSHPVR